MAERAQDEAYQICTSADGTRPDGGRRSRAIEITCKPGRSVRHRYGAYANGRSSPMGPADAAYPAAEAVEGYGALHEREHGLIMTVSVSRRLDRTKDGSKDAAFLPDLNNEHGGLGGDHYYSAFDSRRPVVADTRDRAAFRRPQGGAAESRLRAFDGALRFYFMHPAPRWQHVERSSQPNAIMAIQERSALANARQEHAGLLRGASCRPGLLQRPASAARARRRSASVAAAQGGRKGAQRFTGVARPEEPRLLWPTGRLARADRAIAIRRRKLANRVAIWRPAHTRRKDRPRLPPAAGARQHAERDASAGDAAPANAVGSSAAR